MKEIKNVSIHLRDFIVQLDKIDLQDIEDFRSALHSFERFIKRGEEE